MAPRIEYAEQSPRVDTRVLPEPGEGMNSEQAKDTGGSGTGSKAIDEAVALNSLVSALAPLDQASRIRLLRTVSIFFELSSAEIYAEATAPQRGLIPGAPDMERRTGANPSFSEDRSMSPKAFLLEKRPQSDVERIACLAYYLTHYRDQPNFKTLDLSKLNTEAAQIKLSNPTRAVDNAAGAHFLIPAGQGRKQLSAIGEVYVQALPDRIAARDAIADLKRKRAKSKIKISGGEDAGSNDVPDDEPFEGKPHGSA